MVEFRGKRIDNGEWVRGMLMHKWACGTQWNKYLAIQLTKDGNSNLVIPSTIAQFTPIHDKNNKQVCGGDIVKAKYEDLLGVEREVVGVVEIGEFEIMLDFPNDGIKVPMRCFYTDDPEDFEIIGNQTDNKDLLK